MSARKKLRIMPGRKRLQQRLRRRRPAPVVLLDVPGSQDDPIPMDSGTAESPVVFNDGDVEPRKVSAGHGREGAAVPSVLELDPSPTPMPTQGSRRTADFLSPSTSTSDGIAANKKHQVQASIASTSSESIRVQLQPPSSRPKGRAGLSDTSGKAAYNAGGPSVSHANQARLSEHKDIGMIPASQHKQSSSPAQTKSSSRRGAVVKTRESFLPSLRSSPAPTNVADCIGISDRRLRLFIWNLGLVSSDGPVTVGFLTETINSMVYPGHRAFTDREIEAALEIRHMEFELSFISFQDLVYLPRASHPSEEGTTQRKEESKSGRLCYTRVETFRAALSSLFARALLNRDSFPTLGVVMDAVNGVLGSHDQFNYEDAGDACSQLQRRHHLILQHDRTITWL